MPNFGRFGLAAGSQLDVTKARRLERLNGMALVLMLINEPDRVGMLSDGLHPALASDKPMADAIAA